MQAGPEMAAAFAETAHVTRYRDSMDRLLEYSERVMT